MTMYRRKDAKKIYEKMTIYKKDTKEKRKK